MSAFVKLIKKAAVAGSHSADDDSNTDRSDPGAATLKKSNGWVPGKKKPRPPNAKAEAAPPTDAVSSAAAAPPQGTPIARGGPSSVVAPSANVPGSKLDRAKDKLLHTEISPVVAAPLGPDGALGARVFGHALAPTDPVIADDAYRAATTQNDPQHKVWVHSGAVIDVGVALSRDGTLGNMPVGIGGGASGLVEWSALTYQKADASTPGRALGALTRPPLSADAARGMAQGEEFFLREAGAVGVSVGATPLATSMGAPGPVSATLHVAASKNKSELRAVNVKKLDGDKVFVRLGHADESSHTSLVSFTVTPGYNAADMLQAVKPRYDGAVRGILERNNDLMPDTRNAPSMDASNARTALVHSLVNADTHGALTEALQFQLNRTTQHTQSERHADSFVLDLSNEDDRKAYEALLRGAIGQGEPVDDHGTKQASYDETGESRGTALGARIGPVKLFLIESLRSHREGTLKTAAGTVTARQELFQRRRTGLLGGKRAVVWEGATWKRDGQPPQSYFHLSFEKRDGATRKDEVQQFQRFFSAMGAEEEPGSVDEARKGGLGVKRLFDGPYGNSTWRADVYFTRDGLQRLSEASEPQVIAAFARAAQQVEGTAKLPAWAEPQTADAAQRALDAYSRHRLEHPQDTNGLLGISAAYQRAYGRDLPKDLDDLDAARQLARQVGRMKGQQEADWDSVFADLGSRAKFDFWRQLATLRALAGDDETLVHELSIYGDRIKLSAKDKGLIESADDVVKEALSPPPLK